MGFVDAEPDESIEERTEFFALIGLDERVKDVEGTEGDEDVVAVDEDADAANDDSTDEKAVSEGE